MITPLLFQTCFHDCAILTNGAGLRVEAGKSRVQFGFQLIYTSLQLCDHVGLLISLHETTDKFFILFAIHEVTERQEEGLGTNGQIVLGWSPLLSLLYPDHAP